MKKSLAKVERTADLVETEGTDRAAAVKQRIIELARNANDLVIENGLLLREYMKKKYFKTDGFSTFNEAIQSMQDRGVLDYGPRNARNFVAIVDMVEHHGLSDDEYKGLGVSKLREIAAAPEKNQRELLEAASGKEFKEIQELARQARAKASGQDVDPLHPVTIMLTESQRTFYTDSVKRARRIHQLPDTMNDAGVLVDTILSEWFAGSDEIEANDIQGEVIASEVVHVADIDIRADTPAEEDEPAAPNPFKRVVRSFTEAAPDAPALACAPADNVFTRPKDIALAPMREVTRDPNNVFARR